MAARTPLASDTAAVGTFDLDGIARAAADSRGFVLAGVLLATLILVGTLLASRLAIPAIQSFQIGMRFVFPEAANGRYPNGSRFSVIDVIAPDLVERVYRENKLTDHRLTLEDFASAVSIAPYALDRDLIVSRYSTMLERPELTFVERQKLERELRQELEATRGRSAVLMLTLQDRLGLSESLGRKVLRDLVTTWSRSRIEDYGVLQLPEAARSAAVIDVAKLVSRNPVIAASKLEAFATNVRSSLSRLDKRDGAQTLVDKTTGKTVTQLLDDLYAFDQFELPQVFLALRGLASPDQRIGGVEVLQQRIEAFERRKQLERGRADAIAAALASRGQQQREPDASRSASPAASQQSANPVSPQLSESFLERIIDLSDDAASRAFREKLTEDEIRLRRSAIDMAGAQARIERQIAVFSKGAGTASVAPDVTTAGQYRQARSSSAAKADQVAAVVKPRADMLNEIAGTTQRLFEKLGGARRGYGGMLVQLFEVENEDAYSISHPILNLRVLLASSATLLGITLLLLAAGILWQLSAGVRSSRLP